MLDWDIKLGSALAREYFESAIAEKYEVRNTYARIKWCETGITSFKARLSL